MDENNAKIKSLYRAIKVLDCFKEKQPLGVTEICNKLGMTKSNVYNILMTFVEVNYLRQDPDSSKFWLSRGVYGLGRALGEEFAIANIVHPVMEELSEQFNENVYFSVPSQDEIIYADVVYPKNKVLPFVSLKGWREKMYCTAGGKAMLMSMDETKADNYIKGELIKRTEHTITDYESMKKELSISRKRGYAIDNMELEIGTICVAVPVFNHNNSLEGALTVSGISSRFESDRIEIIAKSLIEKSKKIQASL